MKFPRFLSAGDAIGVTAPSFGVTDPTDINRFRNAIRRLEERGYRVIETPDVYTADETGRSAPADQRVRELYSLLADPSVAYIVSAKGGEYQHEMLLHMDWDLMSRSPKWIQGYSDNTVLLFKITTECDVATIYGGNFGDYGMDPWHRSITENMEVIEGSRTSQTSFPYHEVGFADRVTGLEGLREEAPVEWVSPSGDVRFSGRLIGGCMDVLEWFHRKATADPRGFIRKYADDGIVWYMETYDMDESRISRMLNGMSDDGWFENVTGFVFGRPLFFKGEDYIGTVCDALSGFDVPKVFGADVGHKAPRMTFINGAVADFDVHGGSCELTYAFDS